MTIKHLAIPAIIVLIIAMILAVARIFRGPSSMDRLNALSLLGTDSILFILLLGYYMNQLDFYVDIAITYGIIGFVSFVIIAKYIYYGVAHHFSDVDVKERPKPRFMKGDESDDR